MTSLFSSHTICTVSLLAGLMFSVLAERTVSANDDRNLFRNGDLRVGTKVKVSNWQFKGPTSDAKLEPGWQQDGSGNGELFIRKIDGSDKHHVWWMQTIPVNEGQKYLFNCQGRAWGAASYSVYIGAEFRDATGKWIGYTQLCKIACRSLEYPSSNTEAVQNWKNFTATIIPPRGAKSLTIRLALDSATPAEAHFRHLELTTTALTMAEVFNQTPSTLPLYHFKLGPVSAQSITLTPVWNNEGAETWQSATRQRLCLNGLWAIQPVLNNVAPRENDWGYMKIPGLFHCSATPYFIYGQDKTSWRTQNLARTADAVWYARDIEVPPLKNHKFFLNFSGQRGLSLRIYWNGRPIGQLTDQMGGRIALANAVQPGEKGQLVIFARATPSESKYAFLMEGGKMERTIDVSRHGIDGGMMDIYLDAEPPTPHIVHTQAIPSTRCGKLEINIVPASGIDPAQQTYAVIVKTLDGKKVKEVTGLRGIMRDGRFFIGFDWPDARRWSPDDPWLYQYHVCALDNQGRIIDETLPSEFGFREIWVQGRHLMMNGQPLRLRPRLSFTMYMDTAAEQREFTALKSLGFNCIMRPTVGTTHELESWNLESPDGYFRLADRMGMMVISYTAYALVSGGQFDKDKTDFSDILLLTQYINKHQIARLADHPSVVAYSGFGTSAHEGVNFITVQPDAWGVTPLDRNNVLDKFLSDGAARKKALQKSAKNRDFISRIKNLDPSRPFLSHFDSGEGDGWGIFDYFNWTPLQEWEEWPEAWYQHGTMPIGSVEHGLPYPSSFVNHGIPDGDNEPWVTEYCAMLLGEKVYADEPQAYLQFIRANYNVTAGTFAPAGQSHHTYAANVVAMNPINTQKVWAFCNKPIYRTWRTYGVPMGLEPFGRAYQFWNMANLRAGNNQIVAAPDDNLQASGAHMDSWFYNTYWPSATTPVRLSQPDAGLEPLGKCLRSVNQSFLAYIAGASDNFTAKDHVFWSGEKVNKQIALVWDGFTPLPLVINWSVELGGQKIATGQERLTLSGGEIKMLPLSFISQTSQFRAVGRILLSVHSADSRLLTQDEFAFQVYAAIKPDSTLNNAKIAVFDPAGDTLAAVKRLGLNPISVTHGQDAKGSDLLIVGRNALVKLKNLPFSAVPPHLPILVMEQNDQDLGKLGFHAYPSRPRQVFSLPGQHPIFNGVEQPELSNWRVNPQLLSASHEPLRDGYNYNHGYRGAVASVTLETPTNGNFTPLLQCGFDLCETPLLESQSPDRRWMFCQLSLVDGAGLDPVATRIFVNLLNYMEKPVRQTVELGVVGNEQVVKMLQQLGSPVKTAISADAISNYKLLLVGPKALPAVLLKNWIKSGGTAWVLPQDLNFYREIDPALKAKKVSASLVPFATLPSGTLMAGLGQNDFHYRQPLELLQFNAGGNMTELTIGQGKLILLGFSPETLDLKAAPYLQLTYRHQYRVIAQLFTNSGVSLPRPLKSIIDQLEHPTFKFNISDYAQARITEYQPTMKQDWIKPEFNASNWAVYSLKSKSTLYGHAALRVSFRLPPEMPVNGLLADLGTFDDYDECYLNGTPIGSTNPANSSPETAYAKRRIYPIPAGVLRPGKDNVLAIHTWNRNAHTKGWITWVRGPLQIYTVDGNFSPYVGDYKHSDDPYLQHHW